MPSALLPGASAREPPSLEPAATTGHDLYPEPVSIGPNRFWVLGPLPNGQAADGRPPRGVELDLLASIGGEAEARIASGTSLSVAGTTVLAREALLDSKGTLDLHALYGGGDTDLKVAYAAAEWDAPVAVRALALFSSDDGAAVWLNGRRVHRVAGDRPIQPNQDRFELSLVKGKNRLLVKVENTFGGWGFALSILDAEGRRRFEARETRRHLERLDPGPDAGVFWLTEYFPDIVWRSARARLVFGDEAPRVRWFGPDLVEVQQPERMGRYVALIEATTLDGYAYRRMLTFAKVPRETLPSFPAPPFSDGPLLRPPGPVDWNEAQVTEFSRHVWRATAEYLKRGEGAAIAATALLELNTTHAPAAASAASTWLDNGFIQNAEHQLKLRMKLEQRTRKPLQPPTRLERPAPTLHSGGEREAGMKPGTVQKLRTLSREWARDDPNGFVLLVARRGHVFLHEGFNGFTKDTRFAPASIGKSSAGLLFARAVDQGLLRFDQPISSVLPDFKDAHMARLTFRHCFQHVTGLTDHGSHAGLFNAYLDNALRIQNLAFSMPLTRFQYNGDAFNLAGKALELTTGQSIWRMLHEQLFLPFEEPIRQLDLGFGSAYTAAYLAKVGQMLLQDGAYGKHRFFKAGFVSTLRPQPIVQFVPGAIDPELDAGIGQAWMTDPPGPRPQGVLGPNVLGHGASSGTAWRVDLDNQFVVVIGRDRSRHARANDIWIAKFMTILAENRVD